MFGLYVGMETMSNSFIPLWAHFLNRDVTGQKGALLQSAFAGAFTVGRASSILIALKLKPHHMLFINFLITAIANGVLYFLAHKAEMWIWIGVILLGLGFSAIFPSTYAFLEQH